jgi:hypothetical protein
MTAIEPAKQTDRQTNQPSNLPAEREELWCSKPPPTGRGFQQISRRPPHYAHQKNQENEEKLYVMTMVDQNAN